MIANSFDFVISFSNACVLKKVTLRSEFQLKFMEVSFIIFL